MSATTDSPLLRVQGLTKHFAQRKGFLGLRPAGAVRAVDGVSFDIAKGETLGLVGESGCGKSTTGRLLVRLLDPTAGRILFDGTDIATLRQRRLRPLRPQFQIIAQDPYGSLNPRMRVEEILREPMQVAGMQATDQARRVRDLLDRVGLAAGHASRFPHEFSGGQRQRIAIARSLALRPRLVVCDEPVSALDVSVQAQIINLLKDLQREMGLAYLFVAHDLSVVRHISDRVAVMYLGQMVEVAPKRSLFATPRHPYTRALLSSVPVPRPGAARQRIVLSGDVPSPVAPPSGCRFHTRCPQVQAICSREEPLLQDNGDGRAVACHFADP
ncbi:ABC transporter ATP-binding protein [Falsiroseomonas sp. E2-1-a20]|uniref:ABC transporter ATP-binding protein n=1 Tax=Falsiroseomonas sp. E2-1-a20 TaxID=3239300 RepID=UPI003F39010A